MDNVKLRVRKQRVIFQPPEVEKKKSITTSGGTKRKATIKKREKNVSVKKSSRKPMPSKLPQKQRVDGEIIGGWGGSSTRPSHLISKPIPPPVPKKASPVKKPKPPPVRVPLTFVYGTSEKDQTKCVWDGNKKVTLLHFSEGVVVKEKVKEYWSVALAREKFWKGWSEKEGGEVQGVI